jgi:hypothetical protein
MAVAAVLERLALGCHRRSHRIHTAGFTLLNGLQPPEPSESYHTGSISIGMELGWLPTLDAGQTRIGFNGKAPEDLPSTSRNKRVWSWEREWNGCGPPLIGWRHNGSEVGESAADTRVGVTQLTGDTDIEEIGRAFSAASGRDLGPRANEGVRPNHCTVASQTASSIALRKPISGNSGINASKKFSASNSRP